MVSDKLADLSRISSKVIPIQEHSSPFVLFQCLEEFIIAVFECIDGECRAHMGQVFAKLFALACPVKVCHEMQHAPSVVKLWGAGNK